MEDQRGQGGAFGEGRDDKVFTGRMDRSAAHSQGIDHRHPASGDIVAIADPARALPRDRLTQCRAALLDQPEQLFGLWVDRLGRAREAAVTVDRNVVLERDVRDQRGRRDSRL